VTSDDEDPTVTFSEAETRLLPKDEAKQLTPGATRPSNQSPTAAPVAARKRPNS
jgi:hypothetical protein